MPKKNNSAPKIKDFEARLNSSAARGSKLVHISPEDVVVKEVERESRYNGKGPRLSATTPHICQCLELYQSTTWTTVSYMSHAISCEVRDPSGDAPLQQRKFDVFDAKNAPTKPPPTSLPRQSMEPFSAEKKANLVKSLRAAELPLFRVHTILPEYVKCYDTRPTAHAPSDTQSAILKVRVRCRELKFALGDIEPFFCSLHVIDISTGARLSEVFHFTLSPPELLGQLRGRGPSDPFTESTTAIFSFSRPSSSIMLLLRVEKVLRGDVEAATEPYFKHATLKPKERAKFVAEASECAQRLGGFTQPFAAGLIPLFDDSGVLVSAGLVTFANMVRLKDYTDEYIVEKAAQLVSERELKKHQRVYPGRLVLEIAPVEGVKDVANVVDSSWQRSGVHNPQQQEISREIQEFYDTATQLQPHLNFQHNLYAYPTLVSMNNYKGKCSGRNICLSTKVLPSDADAGAVGLSCLYGRAAGPQFADLQYSPVNYHERKPGLYDEFKVALPIAVTPTHHLLFTVSHIACAAKKKDKGELATPMAFSSLAILADTASARQGMVADGEHQLRTAYSYPPGYLAPDVQENSVKFVEKQRKPNLFLKLRLISTLYAQDDPIDNFFSAFNTRAATLLICVRDLANAQPASLVRFFYPLANMLLMLVGDASPDMGPACLVTLATMMYHADCAFVAQPLRPALPAPGRRKVDKADKQGPEGPLDAQPPVDIAARNPYFVTYLRYVFRNSMYCTCKDAQPNKPFEGMLAALHECIKNEVPGLVHLLRYTWFFLELINKSVAMFLHDKQALAVPNRASQPIAPDFFSSLESMLVLLSAHVRGAATDPCTARLSMDVALFLRDLLCIVDRGQVLALLKAYLSGLVASAADTSAAELKAAILHLLSCHEHYVALSLPLATRIGSPTTMHADFCAAHPYCGLLLDELHTTLAMFPTFSLAHTSIRKGVTNTLRNALLRADTDPRYKDDKQSLTSIASAHFPFILTVIDMEMSHKAVTKAEREENCIMLTCFLYILQKMDRSLLKSWWCKDTQQKVQHFFVILNMCIKCFEYKTSETTGDAASAEKHSVSILSSQNMSAEVTRLVLELLMEIIDDYEEDLKQADHPFMQSVVFSVIMAILNSHQCDAAVVQSFRVLSYVTSTFVDVLFKFPTSFCGAAVEQALRYANSSHAQVRESAACLFFQMVHTNWVSNGNFSRMKLQSNIALSKLVEKDFRGDPVWLRSAMEGGADWARGLVSSGFPFDELVDLKERLFTVVRNSLALRKYAYDPERYAELLYEIVVSYKDSPDLQVAWLLNLAQYQETEGHLEEAAQAKLFLGALAAVYINYLKPDQSITIDKALFKRASPNILEYLMEPQHSDKEEGICMQDVFTRSGLFSELQQAVAYLNKAGLYETCVEVNRLLVGIQLRGQKYSELVSTFDQLQELCEKIVSSNQSFSRIFANYYRVSFFGQKFGDLDGKTFVYKETSAVRLAEISDRLKVQYEAQLGKVTVIQKVDKALDPSQLFLQIGSVQPYVTKDALASRTTIWEQNTNLNHFVYEVPFTKSGKSYSDNIAEQYKKKIVLKVERPFPFVTTRAAIVDTNETVLEPIESSLELIENRCSDLRRELKVIPTNLKTLQIVLQGSVLLQVNAGPLEICKVFLGNSSAYPPEKVALLKDQMGVFVNLCSKAVQVNKSVIANDQIALQTELERGLGELRARVESYVGAIPPLSGDDI